MSLSDLFTIACAAAALAGILLGLVGSRRFVRALRRGYCPSCGYDLRMLPSPVCPECGPGRRPGRWRAAGLIAASLAMIALLPSWLLWPQTFRTAWWWVRYPTWEPVATTAYGPLVIKEYKGGRPDNEALDRYVAEFDGHVLRDRVESWPVHAGIQHHAAEFVPYPGPDVNGDGKPDVVLLEYSGGAHCCYTAYFYDVAGTPVLMGQLDTYHTPPTFKDLAHDGRYEVEVFDWTWDYFYAFTEAPAPRVVLRWQGGQFLPAPDLMRTDPPDEQTLNAYEEELRLAKSYLAVPPSMLHRMLELMYTGHEALAWRLFDTIYPTPTREQDGWRDRVHKSLDSSPYWPALHRAWAGGG